MAEAPVDPASNEATDLAGSKRRRAHVPAAERRRQIVAAAQQVFARTSLQGAKTRDLAKAANVNQATLFEHFRSKEALFQAAVVEPLLESMRGMRDRAHSYEAAKTIDALRHMARPSAQRHIDVMIKIFPLLTAALFSDLEAGKKLYREQLAPLLRQRAEAISGFVKPDLDPELVELIGFGSLFAIAMDQTLADRPFDRSILLDQWLQISTTGFAIAHHELGRRRAPQANRHLGTRRRLGRSELQLAPLTLSGAHLGSMAGTKVLERYLERGGNCIDIPQDRKRAAIEQALAKRIAGRREQLVLATHASLASQPVDSAQTLHACLLRELNETFARLRTDTIDLLFLHGWNLRLTPAEVFSVCETLQRSGKVRYIGVSAMPAWQAARLQTLAELKGEPLVALQTPFGSFERTADSELLTMARDLELGVLPTFPLGDGTAFAMLERIAAELECSPAQVALAWALFNPTVVSPVIDPRTLTQLDDACAALDISLGTDQVDWLNGR